MDFFLDIAPTLFSFLHFTVLLIMVGALAAEAFLLRLPPTAAQMRTLARADAFYGGAAGLMIVVGFLRVFYGTLNSSYYLESLFFWLKIAAFILIGILSIPPTLRFLRWSRALKTDENFQPPEAEVKTARRFVMIELHLLAVVILFAALMVRAFEVDVRLFDFSAPQ